MEEYFQIILEWTLEKAAGLFVGAVVASLIMWIMRTRDFRSLRDEISNLSNQQETQQEDFNRQVERLKEQVTNARLEQIQALVLAVKENQSPPASPDQKKKQEADSSITYRQMWEASPGSGRAAAHLILTVDTVDEARTIYDAHRASPKLESSNWANYAMIIRLDFEQLNEESFALSCERSENPDEMTIDEQMVKTLSELHKKL